MSRRTVHPDSAEIRPLVEENPGRPGTVSYTSFDIASRSQTIREYRDAGGNLKYLRWHAGRGKLAIIA